MSLELKVEVGEARSSLEQIRTSVAELKSAFNEFKGGSALERALTRIGQFQGLNANAVHSVGELGRALDKISASSTSSLSGVSTALKALAGINVGTVAQNVSKLSTALSSLKVPSSLTTVAQTLSAIGTAASTASGQVGVLASNLNKVRAPNIGNLANQIGGVGSAARSAQAGVYGFGNGLSTLTGLVAGFGISLGGVGIAQFISASWDAGRALSQFSTQMTGLLGSGQLAQTELDYVKKAAINLGLPLNESLSAYSRLMQAFQGTAAGTEGARTVFEGFGTALAALGANSEQSERTFRALTQMVNKGKITAEEFTQQLGDGVIPAMRVMMEATGKSAAEIFKLMEAGKLGTDELIKMAETLKSKYGSSVEAAMKTAFGAMRQLTTAVTVLQAEFGKGLGEGMREGLNSLTRAIMEIDTETGKFTGNLTAFGQSIASVGNVIGSVFGTMGSLIGGVAQHWSTFGGIINGVIVGLGALMAVNFAAWIGPMIAASTGFLLSMNPWAKTISLTLGALTALGTYMGGWANVVMGAVSAANSFAYTLGLISEATYKENLAIIENSRHKQQNKEITDAVTASTGGYSSSLSGASEKTREFGAAQGQAAAESAQLDAAIAATTGSTRTFDGLMNEINGTFTTVNGQFDDVVTSGNTFDSLLGSMGGKTNTFDSALQGANTSMGAGSKAAEVIAGAYDNTGTSASTSAGKVEVIAGAYDDTATSANQAYGQVDAISGVYEKTGTAAGNAATGAGNAATNISRSATSASNAIEPINRLAEAYSKAAAAARSLKAAESGSSGGDVGGDTGGYSGGGIVGNAPTSQWAPISAFAGAPKFEGGTANTNNYPASLPGGGIPSILHANEAVVPLTGGGAIPVQMTGGGVSSGPASSAGGSSPMAMELLTLAQLDYTLQGEMKVELYRIWESVDLFMTVSKEHWSKVDADHLQMINHLGVIRTAILLENSRSAAMLEAINKLPTGLTEIKSAIETLATSVSSGMSDLSSAISNIQTSSSSNTSSTTPTSSSNTTSASSTTSTPTSSSSSSSAFNQVKTESRYSDTFGYGQTIQYGKNKETGKWETISNPSFATGSPNAWRDVRGVPSYADGTENTNLDGKGGFMAMLHPNEAVIPLPDGRTVPVSLSGDAMAGSGGGDNSVTVNVTMNVDAKDASSFAASKKQLVQELEAEMKKTARKLGKMSVEDDPTMRVT